jgi:4-amino-4-deoxy-L-arabinose transferase-like glycosyltransferase
MSLRPPWRSPADQPSWARPALLALAAVAATVYAWRLPDNPLHGYYAPAVKSMSVSWRAFFYGGYDPAASITLDKLPGAFMVQALSARLFGFHTWSVVLPQVVETVVTILVLYRVVRRWQGPAAGLLAATAYAATPIVAALARAGISDTLLVMLLVLAADAWQRGVSEGRLRPLLLSGGWVGLAFQTKMVQAWGVLPAFAVAYLVAAPGTVRRRLGHLGLAGLVTVAVSMWWIALVLLTPASARPYVDGSSDNSPLTMVFQYNLLSRYGMAEDPSVNFGPPGGGGAGWSYLLADGIASQVGWLYPLALAGLVFGLWWGRRAERAGYLMWGLWLAVHGVAFSTGRVAHSFYVVALAPPLAALAGAGLVTLWNAYQRGGWQRWLLPATVAANAVWAAYLAHRFATFLPWLPPLVLGLGVLAVAALLPRGRTALVAGVLAVAGLLVAPAAWSSSTVDSRYAGGAIGPAAGPAGDAGPRGGGPFTVRQGGPPPGALPPGAVPFVGGPNGGPGGGPPLGGARGPGRGPGGFADQAQTGALITWLRGQQHGEKYLVAAQGSQQAGSLILAGASVLPMGGFSGAVPFPTVNQLERLVATGQLRFVMLGGGPGGPNGGPGGPRQGNSAVVDWVTANCTVTTAASVQVYDCKRQAVGIGR